MRIAKIGLASPAVLALISSVTLAQQAITGTGTLTIVDRIHGTVAIRQTQDGTAGASGTVGASSNGGAAAMFRLRGPSLDTLHAGDR
jgi:hypothetical protein